MLTCLKYNKKEVKKVNISGVSLQKDLFFIDITQPTDKEIKDLSKKTGISIIDINYTLKNHIKTILQNRDNYCYIIYKRASKYGVNSSGIFISKKFIVTVHKRKSESISKIIKDSNKQELAIWFNKGLPYLVYKILLDITKHYSKEILEISEKLERTENKIFATENFSKNIKTVFYHKKSLLFYRDSLIKNRDLVEDIQEGDCKFIVNKDLAHFNDLKNELSETIGVLDMIMKSAQDTMDVSIGMEANKLNDFARSFAVIATFILIPTLISGIWGMNFAKIPFFNNQFGFYIPIILMILSITIVYVIFKAKKWM